MTAKKREPRWTHAFHAVADDSLPPQDKFKLDAKFKPGASLQFSSASYDNHHHPTFIPNFGKFHGAGKDRRHGITTISASAAAIHPGVALLLIPGGDFLM
jgi:hypothetical protein